MTLAEAAARVAGCTRAPVELLPVELSLLTRARTPGARARGRR